MILPMSDRQIYKQIKGLFGSQTTVRNKFKNNKKNKNKNSCLGTEIQ